MSQSDNSFRGDELSSRKSFPNTPYSRQNNNSYQNWPDEVKNGNNPYLLVKKQNKIIAQQKLQLEEYQIALQSLNREKSILLSEKTNLEKKYMSLNQKIDCYRGSQNFYKNSKATTLDIMSNKSYFSQESAKKSLFNILSPTLRKSETNNRLLPSKFDQTSENKNIGILNLNQKPQLSQQQEYIPQPVRLCAKSENSNFSLQSQQKSQLVHHQYAQNFMQDFMIIGPQINDFKNKRNLTMKSKPKYITTNPTSLYNYNRFYQKQKSQFIHEICRRAFPQDCQLTRKLIQSNQQLYQFMQFKPSNSLSSQYFVFTLKGDESLLKKNKKAFLNVCNPNHFLYVFCLKIPDLVHVRDEKNYHRKQSEVWITQKIYAIVTYYPFFPIIISLLYQIQNLLWENRIKKVVMESENPLLWGLTKNCYDLEKREQIMELLNYFSKKRPEPNQAYHISNNYLGLIPESSFKLMYPVAINVCPLFFTSFCYEEFLFLLTAIILQKTLIFISKYQSMSTLCALFFTNLIHPFRIQTILLNCDSQRLNQLIFEFPFSMLCSVKKTEKNFEKILYLFAESNVERTTHDDARYIVIDVDTNTILYHHVIEEKIMNCLVSPGEKVRKLYMDINQCESKSFSTTKTLQREHVGNREKFKSEIEKRQQEKKKYAKQYLQRINNNKTKSTNYGFHQNHQILLKHLTQYIQSFTLDQQIRQELSTLKNKNSRNQIVKKHLLQRSMHKNKNKLIENFLQSQLYANYLDSELYEATRI